jgi:hypothetical protein
MNSHRLIASLKAQDKASFRLSLAHWKAPGLRSPPISAFASKADIAKRPGHFRLPQIADSFSELPEPPQKTWEIDP